MTVVVADASPLRYLVLVGCIDALPRLFETIVAPEYVTAVELRHPKTPREVKDWAAALPPWIKAQAPQHSEDLGLHRGESDAIALALELKAFAVLLDDADARAVAAQKHLRVIGTIGILEAAADRDLLNLREAFQRLSQTNFRIKPELLRETLSRHENRPK